MGVGVSRLFMTLGAAKSCDASYRFQEPGVISPKISRAEAHVRFSRYRAAQEAAPEGKLDLSDWNRMLGCFPGLWAIRVKTDQDGFIWWMMSAEEARTEGTVITEELKTSCDVRGRYFFRKDRLDPDSQQKSSSKNPPLQHSQGGCNLPGARRKHRGNPAVQAFDNVVKGRDLIVCNS
jgi:hypothetical protein